MIENAQGTRRDVREQLIAPPFAEVRGIHGTMRVARATVRLEMPVGFWHPSVLFGDIILENRLDDDQTFAYTGWHVDQRARDMPGQMLAMIDVDKGVVQGDCRALCPALRMAIGTNRRAGAPAVRDALLAFLQGTASGGFPRDEARTMEGPTQSRVRTIDLALLQPMAQRGAGDQFPSSGRLLAQPTDERNLVIAYGG